MKRAVSLLLALLLVTGLTQAVETEAVYPDLPTHHWAYNDMSRALELGALTPYPDGTVRPDAPLTWEQWLRLVRSCYPAAPGTDYEAALAAGVLSHADFLPVSALYLGGIVTRQEGAVLQDRVLRAVYGAQPVAMAAADMAYTDWDSLTEPYRGPVAQCSARKLFSGYPDGSFGGRNPLTRGAGAALVFRTAELGVALKTAANPADALTRLGDNGEKRMRLFGSTTQRRYPTETDAAAHMTPVTVPVWSLDRGTGIKKPATAVLTVHSALAEEVKAIFTEIYNDPEQFPLYGLEGYAWRGDGAAGEHNCGTAIDLNYKENYQVYDDGRVGAGSYWSPGSDPFSLPPEGSVVRIFAAHGFSWGGTAWRGSKDYMHFSYLGG
ncbi:MAG: S-layer homology domain-containing protein [Pseudoflavonifractor sp.]